MRTGYATVTRHILNGLSDTFECHCIGHNYLGQTIQPPIQLENDIKLNFTLHGTGRAKYSMDILTKVIRDYKIDVFGSLLDSFMLFEASFMNVDTSPAHTFFYFPSDGGGGLPVHCDNILKKVELPIAMAKFGQQQVKDCHGIDAKYIPHGVDLQNYKPLSEEEKIELRRKWKLTNKFVVGSMFRNQGRKMPGETLKMFKLFCHDKPDAMLLLHTDPEDPARMFDLHQQINKYKLNNRVIFTGTSFYKPFLLNQMNEIYNLMDVYLSSTSGEGWGLGNIEAMACAVPQIITDYTSTREQIMDNPQTGLPIRLAGFNDYIPCPHNNEILDGTITGSWNVERGIPSVIDGAKQLNILYNNKQLRQKLSENCLIKVQEYDWGKVVNRFKEELLNLIK